jgi:hypothetical protein
MSFLTEEQLSEVADKFSRFKEAPWFTVEPLDIIIGGCGGIGSWTALLLSRQAHNLYLFDNDRVEELNLGNQLFKHSDVGENKTQAVANTIRELSGQDNIEQYDLYTKESISGPIMISAFDNMSARKIMFENWVSYVKANPEDNCIFLDGRLSQELMQVFAVLPKDIDNYREHLYDDSEIEELPCGYKQTSHSAAIIAGLITGLLSNFVSTVNENERRLIPFFTELNIPTMFMTHTI